MIIAIIGSTTSQMSTQDDHQQKHNPNIHN